MKVVSGRTVVGGIAIAPLRVCLRKEFQFQEVSELNAKQEYIRFERARKSAQAQMSALYRQLSPEIGDEVASIFDIHRMILEDDDYLDTVRTFLEKGYTAQYAAAAAGRIFTAVFNRMDDSYMQARANDVRDISSRLIRILSGIPTDGMLRGEPVILAVEDLFPSEAAELDRGQLLGIIARCGSRYSHASILAQALHIPAIVEVAFDESWDGKMVILDGNQGVAYVDPPPELLAKWEENPAAFFGSSR